ncbi:dolichyl-phosphate beta-glucosyltransferase (asparagine-linked glycosylation protein 5), putative [Bodo saltans]|uniref:dolichyl-phosphate beta-glucosyltransferase n=1 Tax=Bodo saltans TaxID=75058 RepID=A0A0S4JDQ1_BODSA|nr:dolichyl-phosphate beta-glucosyltransferase (asparagine-linked glycosylation protein 5), putative [Bodo saltans]|eukprot:CUG89608.1 dolichyl-phosphate beta-glucosyltransferase (asparagine-linked glycosylation protein 5), putative [Bodo saltans]
MLIALCVCVVCIVVAIARHFGLKYHTTPASALASKTLRKFRNFGTAPTLSVVIPCYNEEDRLPLMLKDCVAYISKLDAARRAGGGGSCAFRDVELVIVDDCSKDKTINVATKYLDEVNSKRTASEAILFSIVRVNPNRGKGYAVRVGSLAASGDLVLMADGDNATQFSDVERLAARMTPGGKGKTVHVAVGSRAHLEKDSVATRTFFRTVLMKIFHLVVNVTYTATTWKWCHIRDTQCGFKLFRRAELEKIFLNSRIERWAFDVEILLLASLFNLRVIEVPVTWQEIPGSKVNFKGMAQMGLECLLMCFVYPLGFWRIYRNV